MKRTMIALLLAVVLIAAGCGGGGGTSADLPPAAAGVPARGALAPPPPPELPVLGDDPTPKTGGIGTEANAIALAPGWNLFSFPVAQVTSVTRGAAVFPNLYAFSSGQYVAVPFTVEALNADGGTTRAFWAYATDTSSITYDGPANDGGVGFAQLAAGWNLLGFPVASGLPMQYLQVTPTDAGPLPLPSAVCGGVPPADPTTCSMYLEAWHYGSGVFTGVSMAEPGNRFVGGQGVWVYCHEPVRFHYFPVVAPSGGPYVELSWPITDAEYSRPLDRIVAVSSEGNLLHVLDPVTGDSTSVTLPSPPTCVSVGPGGTSAAVGHNGSVSYVELTTPAVVKTIPTTCSVFDVVLAGNGYIYAFPFDGQWGYIRCLKISDGTEVLSSGYSIYPRTRAKLHPDGTSIYGANNGLTPSDFEKYGIANGRAQRLYDSPYHGEYSFDGDLWISDDGYRLFARSGNVFRASPLAAEDMTWNGSVGTTVAWLDHSSAADRLALVPRNTSTDDTRDLEVRLQDASYLTRLRTDRLPWVPARGVFHRAHGRYVFFDSTGTKYHVLFQADASAGLADDWGLVTYEE